MELRKQNSVNHDTAGIKIKNVYIDKIVNKLTLLYSEFNTE